MAETVTEAGWEGKGNGGMGGVVGSGELPG